MHANRRPPVPIRVVALLAAYIGSALGTQVWLWAHPAYKGAPSPSAGDLFIALAAFPIGLFNLSGAAIPPWLPYAGYASLMGAAIAVTNHRAYYTLFALILILLTGNVAGCVQGFGE
jgi:hypothetical protein